MSTLVASILVSAVASVVVSLLVSHLIYISPIKAEGRRVRKQMNADLQREMAAIKRGQR